MPLILDPTLLAQGLEALMLLCFGLAWPLNTLAMLRRRRPEGKGLTFTAIIWCGYLCGAGAKLLLVLAAGRTLPPVFWLYVINALTVGLNALVYQHFKRRGEATFEARAGRAGAHAA
jgi:hypothetical protein